MDLATSATSNTRCRLGSIYWRLVQFKRNKTNSERVMFTGLVWVVRKTCYFAEVFFEVLEREVNFCLACGGLKRRSKLMIEMFKAVLYSRLWTINSHWINISFLMAENLSGIWFDIRKHLLEC